MKMAFFKIEGRCQPRLLLLIFLSFLCARGPQKGWAQDQIHPSGPLIAGLEHLFKVVSPPGEVFAPEKVAALLHFVASDTPSKATFELRENPAGTPACYEFDVKVDLKRILQVAFDPRLPHHITAPSSVRLGHWIAPSAALESLWRQLPGLTKPVIQNGLEFVEITPDRISGAYYAYDAHRTLILLRYQGKNALISLTRQKDVSGVGRRGVCLGSDDEWNYLYTGDKGLALPGLSWVETYMYDAFSAAVYLEMDTVSPRVRCAYFKWLKAGWQEINAVKKEHILQGLERYAKCFKYILEHPALPSPENLRAGVAAINTLSSAQLQEYSRLYFARLSGRYRDQKSLTHLFTTQTPMNNMEMRALLVLEYIKEILGREPLIRLKERREAYSRTHR